MEKKEKNLKQLIAIRLLKLKSCNKNMKSLKQICENAMKERKKKKKEIDNKYIIWI